MVTPIPTVKLSCEQFYQLGEDGMYHSTLITSSGVYHSKVLQGLWIRVEWL